LGLAAIDYASSGERQSIVYDIGAAAFLLF